MNAYFLEEDLKTYKTFRIWPWDAKNTRQKANLFVPPSIGPLLVDWKRLATTFTEEGQEAARVQSGVLGDWLEDHREECITLKSDPVMLDKFLVALRDWFNKNARPGSGPAGRNES
jgi:hypothetical protein